MDWSKLDGFLASKNVKARPPKVKVDRGFKPPPTQGAIDAMTADRRAYQKYRENRAQRQAEITKEVPELARYLRKLEALTPTATFPDKRECSYDLADLAQRYDLARIAKPYDRFLVYELTTEWVRKGFEAQCKKEGKDPEAVDPETFFTVPDPTTLDELRAYLRVSE